LKLPADPVTIPFLGTRWYVHGTTLFNLLATWFAGGHEIRFKISEMILSNRVQLCSISEGLRAERFPCTCHWVLGDEAHGIGVRALEATEPLTRREFDEDTIVAASSFRADCVEIPPMSSYSFAELVVAANKHMLQTLGLRPSGWRLLFNRLELDELPDQPRPLTVRFERRGACDHFLSSVAWDGAKRGRLYFCRVPERAPRSK
jgi:hypothetical protein